MKIKTKFFGEIEISDDKIITFENGIIGFPELRRFALLHDEEKGVDVGIRFLQSVEEPGFSMPVMIRRWRTSCWPAQGTSAERICWCWCRYPFPET